MSDSSNHPPDAASGDAVSGTAASGASASGASASGSAPSPGNGRMPSGARRWLRRGAWGVGGVVGAVLGVALLGVLMLQSQTVATVLVRGLASQFNPLPGTELTVGQAGGSWVTSLRLYDVTLSRTDSTTGARLSLAHVDTLRAQYDLTALLHRELHVTAVSVAGASATMRQAADSSWDWARVLPPAEAETDTSARGFGVRVDRFSLRRGAFEAAFYANGRDSTARARSVVLRGGDLRVDDAIRVRLDTLGLRARLPGDADDLTLAVRGALTPTRVALDSLRLDSPRSHVRGHGLARLPSGPADALDDVDLVLRADPLDFRDVDALLPLLGLDPEEAVTITASASGSGRRLEAALDARFSGGGTVTATASGTPFLERPATALDATLDTTLDAAPADTAALRYRFDAQIRDLTTSLLAPRDPTANRLNADASFALSGPAITDLSGPLRARLTDTRLFGLRTDTTQLAVTFRDGTADVTLDGRLNDAGIRLTGRTRPLDAAPSYTLTAALRDLNAAAFAPDGGVDTRLSGTIRARGALGGDAGLQADLDADLAPSSVGTQRIDGGTLGVRLTPDTLRVDADLALPEGGVQVAGRAARDASERFVLDRVRIDNLNVAALVGDTTASTVSGAFTASGRGFDPQTMTLDATAALDASTYDVVRVDTLSGRIRLQRGALDAGLETTVNGGRWSLAAAGRPFDATPSIRVTEGRFRDVDVGAFAADTSTVSRLDGSFAATLRGTDPQTLTLDAQVRLDASQVHRQRIDRGTLDAQLAGGALTAALQLDVPDGRVSLNATARPFDATPTFAVSDGAFEGVDAGAWAGVDGLATSLRGTLDARGSGATLDALDLDAGLSLKASRVNRAALTGGSARVQMQNGRLTSRVETTVAPSDADARAGRVVFEGRVDSLGATPSYALEASLGALDVGALAGLDTSVVAAVDTAAWTLDGRGATLDALSGTTRLRTGRVRLDRVRLDAVAIGGTLRDGLLAVDTVGVRSNVFDAQGGGTIALAGEASSDFDLVVGVTDTRPLERLAGADRLRLARGRAEVNVYGTAGALRFDGRAELRSLVYNDVRLAQASLQFAGSTDGQRLDRVEVEGVAGFLSLAALSVERTEIDASYDSSVVNARASIRVDDAHTAVLGASLDTRTDRERLTLHTLDLRLGPDRWALLQEASVTYGDAYRVSSLLLYSGDQQIAADGVIDGDGPQSFILTLEQFRMGSVADLFGLSGLDGRLSGSVDLTGPATAPRLSSTLSMDVASAGRPVGTLRMDVDYDSLAVSVDATLTHAEGGTLTARGSVPADLRLDATRPVDVAARPVALRARADSFSVGWIDPFLDPATARDVRGVLAAQIDVGGTLDQPALSGTATLRRGAAYVPALEILYDRAEADVTFVQNQARVDRAVVRAGDGRLRASGVVNFPDLTLGEFDLTLDARNFLAIDSRAYRRGVVDGDMTLRGTTQRPVLTGSVRVQRADVFFTEATEQSAQSELAAVQLREEDQLRLEERFGIRVTAADTTTFDAYQAMVMDLSVAIERDTWLRSQGTPEMNIQFTGDLDVTKEADRDARVFGTIEVLPARSTIRYLGQQFTIDQGTLTFNGDPTLPYLDILAVYEQRGRATSEAEVTIRLTLEGRPDELNPQLASDPQMSPRDILSYLATGRPADDLLAGGGGGSLATQVPLGLATSFVENLAASELGLDVVRIEPRADASYLTLGRYFTPRLFVAVESPLNFENAEESLDLTVEYSLTDALLVRALRRQQSLQLNLLLEYSY